MNQPQNPSSYIYISDQDIDIPNNDAETNQRTMKNIEISQIDLFSKTTKEIDLPVVQRYNRGEKEEKLEKSNEREEESQKQKDKLKVRRFDYLNKYSQHSLHESVQTANEKQKVDANIKIPQRLSRQQRRQRREKSKKYIGESLDTKSVRTGQIYYSKPNTKRKHREMSSSSSLKHRKNSRSPPPPPYFAHLQAYQQNIIQNQDAGYLQQSLLYSPARVSQIISKPYVTLGQSNDSSISRLLSRIPNISTGLSKQISFQNQMLRGQTNQYRSLVARLQVDLRALRQQLVAIKQTTLKQKEEYQKQISILMEQNKALQSYKQRYEILNKEILEMNMNEIYHQLMERQLENNKQNIIAIRNKSKSKSINKSGYKAKEFDNFYENNNELLERLERILDKNCNKTQNISINGNYYERMEEIIRSMEKLVAKNKKFEDFVYNIGQMHRKIEKNAKNIDMSHNDLSRTLRYGQPTLKQLWKWLKQLGYTYSLVEEVKPLLTKKAGFCESQNKDLRELLQIIIINS